MIYLISILVSCALLVGFLILTRIEARHGRILRGLRTRADAHVARAFFVLEHVDLGAFLRDTVRAAVARVAHDTAHIVLRAVRVLERALTRTVYYLRIHRKTMRPTAVASVPLELPGEALHTPE